MCHKQLFKVRKQEFQDSSSDVPLLSTCRVMIRQYCHDVSKSQTLDCLKRYKDELTFDDKCKNIVIRRMIEQNTDYRFNTALQSACGHDIDRHCKEVRENLSDTLFNRDKSFLKVFRHKRQFFL